MIDVDAEPTNVGTLASCGLVFLGILIVRCAQPGLPRPFSVPLASLLPILTAEVSQPEAALPT